MNEANQTIAFGALAKGAKFLSYINNKPMNFIKKTPSSAIMDIDNGDWRVFLPGEQVEVAPQEEN